MDIKGLNPFNALLGQTPKPQRVVSQPAVPVARNLGATQFRAAQSESRKQLQGNATRGGNALQQMGQLASLSGSDTPRNPADAALRRVSGSVNPLRDLGSNLLRPHQALSGFAETAQEQVGPTRARAEAMSQEVRQTVSGVVGDVQERVAEGVQSVQQETQEQVQAVREGAGQAVADVHSQVQGVAQGFQQSITGVKAQAQQVAGGALGALKSQAQELGLAFARVGEQVENLEHQIMMLRPEKVESEVRRVLGQVNELNTQVDQLQTQVNELRQNMGRLGEEKVNALIGPLQQQIDTLKGQRQALQDRIQAALPEGVKIDLEKISAEIKLQSALGELTGKVSRQGASGTAKVDTDVFKAILTASTREGMAGKVEVRQGALRALLEASSQEGVNGEVELNTEAAKLLIYSAKGKVSAELQLKLDALEVQINAQGSDVQGRVSLDRDSFKLLVEASSHGANGYVEVEGDTFRAAVSASTQGGVKAQVEVETDSLKAVLEVAYREQVSAHLGLEFDQVKVEIGANPNEVKWSVTGQWDNASMGVSGRNGQVGGLIRIGDVGIEIGVFDTGVDLPPEVKNRMEALGGRPVNGEMYGVMVTLQSW